MEEFCIDFKLRRLLHPWPLVLAAFSIVVALGSQASAAGLGAPIDGSQTRNLNGVRLALSLYDDGTQGRPVLTPIETERLVGIAHMNRFERMLAGDCDPSARNEADEQRATRVRLLDTDVRQEEIAAARGALGFREFQSQLWRAFEASGLPPEARERLRESVRRLDTFEKLRAAYREDLRRRGVPEPSDLGRRADGMLAFLRGRIREIGIDAHVSRDLVLYEVAKAHALSAARGRTANFAALATATSLSPAAKDDLLSTLAHLPRPNDERWSANLVAAARALGLSDVSAISRRASSSEPPSIRYRDSATGATEKVLVRDLNRRGPQIDLARVSLGDGDVFIGRSGESTVVGTRTSSAPSVRGIESGMGPETLRRLVSHPAPPILRPEGPVLAMSVARDSTASSGAAETGAAVLLSNQRHSVAQSVPSARLEVAARSDQQKAGEPRTNAEPLRQTRTLEANVAVQPLQVPRQEIGVRVLRSSESASQPANTTSAPNAPALPRDEITGALTAASAGTATVGAGPNGRSQRSEATLFAGTSVGFARVQGEATVGRQGTEAMRETTSSTFASYRGEIRFDLAEGVASTMSATQTSRRDSNGANLNEREVRARGEFHGTTRIQVAFRDVQLGRQAGSATQERVLELSGERVLANDADSGRLVAGVYGRQIARNDSSERQVGGSIRYERPWGSSVSLEVGQNQLDRQIGRDRDSYRVQVTYTAPLYGTRVGTPR